METTVLGRTGLTVSRTGFGCLPIQRVSADEAVRMLRRAADAGITFFDTARGYSDSEEKLGIAFAGMRDRVVIATKSHASTGDAMRANLDQSLTNLKTDYIDIFQFHTPPFLPMPGGEDGLYEAALEAKRQGKIRHIGISQHKLALAEEAVTSGLYETVQFPFNHLASDAEIALATRCARENVGFICMKALSGGLITDASIPFAFIRQYPQAVPIWGFQRPEELEQVIALSENPPALDDAVRARMREDREALVGAFCRSCGYCLPCPEGIPIHNANRMKQLITRSPAASWMTAEWQAEMEKVEKCIRCGVCAKRCPYGLKPYETMPGHLAFYREYVREHAGK